MNLNAKTSGNSPIPKTATINLPATANYHAVQIELTPEAHQRLLHLLEIARTPQWTRFMVFMLTEFMGYVEFNNDAHKCMDVKYNEEAVKQNIGIMLNSISLLSAL